ncbi:pyrimidine/purine nucleoside phosphorylase [Paludibacterium yongneupense]|uniref:pyrimidine/purine nucleoside phosphorylase n=1 Tax=Paludibacterium yongneupense TaxID=400061 RepID=UPI00040216CE|nr:pyrimidine/purine nucleoside phosphorylase [Paludibacterium yongneupense]
MSQFDNVSVVKKGNVYFDGKCVSHTVLLADGSRKTLGVILPARLTFTTGAPEVMDVVDGHCTVTLSGGAARAYGPGESFSVPGNSAFDIDVTETLHYVCHYG